MTRKTLKIATRQSPLALWQANNIKQKLTALYPDLDVVLLPMTTKGDIVLDTPLAKIGGKGLFVKELEQALLRGDADIAVHSMKDVPMIFPKGLGLSVICKRENPHDAFVSNNYRTLTELPRNAIIGTSSLRRQCQLKSLRPDLHIRTLRGNVGTRLNKLDQGEYDAIILASAGLIRLGCGDRIAECLSPEVILPAVGQGAIGIETRLDDSKTHALLAPLNDPDTACCVTAERAMNKHLQGGCQVPIAGYATLHQGQIHCKALVGTPNGKQILRAAGQNTCENAEILGIDLAKQLLDQGADQILKAISVDVLPHN